jgi:hypothetical protein
MSIRRRMEGAGDRKEGRKREGESEEGREGGRKGGRKEGRKGHCVYGVKKQYHVIESWHWGDWGKEKSSSPI